MEEKAVIVNKETIFAIIRIVVPAICGVLGVLGYQVDTDSWLNVVLVLTGAVISIYTGWKNNNVTRAAQQAQRVLNEANAKARQK